MFDSFISLGKLSQTSVSSELVNSLERLKPVYISPWILVHKSKLGNCIRPDQWDNIIVKRHHNMCRAHYRQGATSVPLILDCDAVERRNFEIFFLFSLLMDKMGVSCRKNPWNGIENEVSNSTVWRLNSAERCLFRQVEAFGTKKLNWRTASWKKTCQTIFQAQNMELVSSHQLHHFLSSKPLRISKLQIRAVFSCPGLSTSFRACLFQNRIPIGYHYLSSKSWNWYPIFRVTIFSPVFPVFIHNPPDCPQWKSWKNFSRRVEKLKTGILLVSYHCQWSILSSKSMFC